MVCFGFRVFDAVFAILLDQDCCCGNALCMQILEELALNNSVLVNDERAWITNPVPGMATRNFGIEDAKRTNDL